MYLSRVQVDTDNRRKIKDLTQVGAYHNWVERSFPDEIKAKIRKRHLWRLDTIGSKQFLLLLSEDQPDLQKLERYGVADTAFTKNYDELLKTLNVGQKLRFRLTANPTHSVYVPGSKRGRVYPHITAEQQTQWLLQRADDYGFEIPFSKIEDGSEVPNFDITSRDYTFLRRGKTRPVRLSRVSFEGVLIIRDLDSFKEALTKGIGREKAYGMGLLTVIPVG
jgi:CRISPR system Cascade subunit CasE